MKRDVNIHTIPNRGINPIIGFGSVRQRNISKTMFTKYPVAKIMIVFL